jgi:tRNA(Ile)-lysidine synthase
MKKKAVEPPVVAAVSGGPDSVFLLNELIRRERRTILVAHVNHGMRGRESDRDEKLVEELSKKHRLELKILKEKPGKFCPRFEEKAREVRHRFLKELARETGGVVAPGHTADDQVEPILMRFFEGAGISGLKGIPRDEHDGFLRPILHLWKEDIVEYLKDRKIPFREDRSNRDCRFERNWIRHVLVPLLVKRYGKAVKKRIYALGERFRELDDYLASESRRWIGRNVRKERDAPAVFRRKAYSALPSALRIRVLQEICFGIVGMSPNERLLAAMDKSIRSGKPSNRVTIGREWELANRYEECRLVSGGRPARGPWGKLRVKESVGMTPARAKRIAAGGTAEAFDADGLRLPLTIRPLRQGDRILPFGQGTAKKVKEILIDRKIPREERWGRPAVCDSGGTILWIPGVLRSGHAPVTPATRCVKILSYFA